MSGIRKFTRRKKTLNKLKKTKTKITILDGILCIGLTITIAGILLGVFGYFYYTGGRPEGIIHTIYGGTFHVEREESGLSCYRDLAKYGAVLTAIGLIISGLSAAFKSDKKKMDT